MTESTKNQSEPFSTVIIINNSDDDLTVTMNPTAFWRKKKFNKIDKGRKETLLQYNKKGSSFHLLIKRNEKGDVIVDEDIKSYLQISVSQSGSVEREQPRNEIANTNRKQNQEAFLALMKQNDYYKVLQVSRQATQEDLRRAYIRLMRENHPDKNGNSLESTFISQRISEAYEFLSDNNKRDMYNKLVDHERGFFSLSRWKSLFADRSRWPYLRLTIPFVIFGAALMITMAAVTVPVAGLVVGFAAGGALLSSGWVGTQMIISEKAAVHGVNLEDLAKKMVVSGAIGAVVGGLTAGLGHVMPGVVLSILPAASNPAACTVLAGAASGGITGAISGAGSVFESAICDGTFKDKSVGACVFETLKGAGTGGLFGVIGGAAVGGIQAGFNGSVANTAADELAGNIAGMEQNAARAALAWVADKSKKMLPPAVKKGIDVARNTVVDKVTQNASKESEFIILKNMSLNKQGSKATIKFDLMEDANSDEDFDETSPSSCEKLCNPSDATDSNPSEDDIRRNSLTFYNKTTGVVSKMEVEYKMNGILKRRTLIDNETTHLPANARTIVVWFEVLRFIGCYCRVKKWDRQNNKWDATGESEIFKYTSPPRRSFTLRGSLYHEAIMEIHNEREHLIFD